MILTLCVSKITAVTDTITEFVLIPQGNSQDNCQGNSALPSYTAGAHIDIELGAAIGSRSYSLIDWSEPPASPTTYTIAVQHEQNGAGGSQRMRSLTLNDTITASAPSNDFELADSSAPAVLIAGGIGVTPIISMVASLQASGHAFNFYYAGRSRSVMAYADKLEEMFGKYLVTYADDDNPLPLDKLFHSIDSATHIYICGPTGLLEAARSAAEKAGIAPRQIHIELFKTPDAKAKDAAFEVELSSSGEVHVIPAGKTIIEVLEAAGHDLLYDCQRGDCGICQTPVISGTPDHRDVVLSDEERASGGVMQICVSRASSDRLVLDL